MKVLEILFVLGVLLIVAANSFARFEEEWQKVKLARRDFWRWQHMSAEDRKHAPHLKPKHSTQFQYVRVHAFLATRVSSVIVLLGLLISLGRY